ncbi:MAG: hypothetical protein AB7E47_00455 [Desulfovibrionaceae bacterium]
MPSEEQMVDLNSEENLESYPFTKPRSKKTRQPMGFLAGRDARPRSHASDSEDDATLLFRFDEGGTISFREGTHNVLVLGGTGRGKTSSVILPMLDRLIHAGFGGLVIDVKGNFTDQARALARLHGREQDIIELGTAASAHPINLFAGLTPDQIGGLLRTLIMSGVEQDRNASWMFKGVCIATDVVHLLHLLAEKEPAFVPSLRLLHAACTDYAFARSLMAYFKEHVMDASRHDHVLFVNRLANVKFHVFTPQDSARSKSDDWEMQLSWNLQRTREILGLIVNGPRLLDNFAAQDATNYMDFGRLIYEERRIVVLRFSPATNAAGMYLARFIKEKYYMDVYANGLDMLQPGMHTFMVADEFQDVMDVNSSSAMNDFSWFGKSREFRNINVVATQSMASLYGHSHNRDTVSSLLANCTTKIVLQLDEPNTLGYLAQYPDLPVKPHALARGRALLFTFSLADGLYAIYDQGVQVSHDEGRARLEIGKELPSWNGHTHQDAPERIATDHPSGLPDTLVAAVLDCDPILSANKQRPSREDEPPKTDTLSPGLKAFYNKHREHLKGVRRMEALGIPPGWLPLADAAMEQCKALGIPFDVHEVGTCDGGLELHLSTPNSPAQAVVHDVFKQSQKTCVLCGGPVRNRKIRKETGRPRRIIDSVPLPMCSACKRKFKDVKGEPALRGEQQDAKEQRTS